MIIGVVCFMILLALALWPARVATRKGHSWLGFFLFSLFFFPALIVACLVLDIARRSP